MKIRIKLGIAALIDLKQRLVTATQEHFAAGILAPILKPGRGLIDLLQEIYK